MWEYTTEAGGIEPLNCDESLLVEVASPSPVAAGSKLTVVLASPPPCEGINYTWPKESIMASLRQLPCKIVLIVFRTYLHHPSLHLDI